MSLLSKAAPFIIVIVLVTLQALCGDVSYTRSSGPVNSNNYNTNYNWPRLQNQQISPLSGLDSSQKATTPWPALGQRNRPSNQYNPTWVRPNQGPIYQRPSSDRSGPNSNFNTGSQYGGQGNAQSNIAPSEVRDDDLREFSEALLTKDSNNAARYVTVNLQSKTTSRSQNDEAPLPLLSINKEAFKISTIEKMLRLHDNYVLETNVNEDNSQQEKNEENSLLETLLGTSVMQHTRDFLEQKGKIGRNPNEFKETLREIWFNMYARGGRKVGSSGFEHVFLAELKNNQVSGLHNWLYFDKEEQNNKANYLGYMKKIDLGNKGAILKYHFTFHGVDKPVGSMFIGTSPEFEMALYTTCFLLRADRICPLKLNGNKFIIRTFTYRYRGKNLIGSAFPEI